MRKEYVLVLDSGIGGLSVLKELVKERLNVNYIYFGDNDNAPYGNKSKEELLKLTLNNYELVKKYKPVCIVLACNTLTVNLRGRIEDCLKIPVFGVSPEIKDFKEKTLLLATPLTCKNYLASNNLIVYPLENLAKDIEDNFSKLNAINLRNHIPINKGRFYRVILGCTHYELIKNQIFNHLKPQIISSGTENCVLQVKEFILNTKSLVKYKQNRILFVGKNAEKNKYIFNMVVKE